MAKVSTYLNFSGNTEETFDFYKTVFGGEFAGKGIMRWADIPSSELMTPLTENEKSLVMHVELPILGNHSLMGSDSLESMGPKLDKGNNVHITLQPDTREETKQLFAALSNEGTVTMELQDTFWESFFGSCVDKFGVHWMFDCDEKA